MRYAASARTAPYRVLHVITGLDGGGAEGMLFKLLSNMSRDLFTSKVVSLTDDGVFGPQLRDIGIAVENIGMRRDLRLGALRKLRAVVAEARPTLIQGWMYHGNVAASFIQRMWASQAKLSWNVRHSLHDTRVQRLRTRALIRTSAWFSAGPDRIIYASQEGAKQHHAIGYRSERTEILPNGFDTVAFAPSVERRLSARQRLKISESSFVVAHVARFHPVKDHFTALDAAARVLAAAPSACFLFIGRGVTDGNSALRARAEELKLGRAVRFMGEYSDVREILRVADLLMLSSRSEGFPNVLGEAMAMEIPCVSTRVGEAPQIVKHAAQLVEPGDAAAMSGAILRFASMAEPERRAFGVEARRHIIDNYGIIKIARQYERLYSALCSSQ